jgi:hypothetical protein
VSSFVTIGITRLIACSSAREDSCHELEGKCVVHLLSKGLPLRVFAGRHVFVLASSSGLRGHKRTYLTLLESVDHALFKMVRYVLRILQPLRPELDAKTKTCLPAKTRFCHLDVQAKGVFEYLQQIGTVSVGSVLKWRARLQCLRSKGMSVPCRWTHIMLRDLLTQKFVNKFFLTDFGYPRACGFRKT